MSDYDLCVVGSGSAGVAAAQAADVLGKRVVLVTGEGALGGTCILRGCMPAKTLLESADRLEEVRQAREFGVREASRAKLDLAALIARKRELVEYFASDRVEEIERFEVARGRARFVSHDAIAVDGRTISADRFLIATGSTIDPAHVPCLTADDVFTSDDALEMTVAPRRLIVIGGGPVGCEFAQYFARVGSEVTLLQAEAELLRNEDVDLGEAVRRTLVDEGVRVVCNATAVRCERRGDARMLTVATERGTMELECDRIMLAAGRRPNTAGLDLAVAGVRTAPGGGVIVDRYLASSNPRVYAAGDVLGRRCLVHVAVYAGALAGRNAFASSPRPAEFERFEAHAVYVQPQLAVVGLSERDARDRGILVRVRRHAFGEIGKAVVSGEVRGFVKMLVDEDDVVRGIAIVGDDGVELAGQAIAVVDRRMKVREVAEMPQLHPTMCEIFSRVAEEFCEPTGERPAETGRAQSR